MAKIWSEPFDEQKHQNRMLEIPAATKEQLEQVTTAVGGRANLSTASELRYGGLGSPALSAGVL